jgi:hypothetical protein
MVCLPPTRTGRRTKQNSAACRRWESIAESQDPRLPMVVTDPAEPHPSAPAPVQGQRHGRGKRPWTVSAGSVRQSRPAAPISLRYCCRRNSQTRIPIGSSRRVDTKLPGCDAQKAARGLTLRAYNRGAMVHDTYFAVECSSCKEMIRLALVQYDPDGKVLDFPSQPDPFEVACPHCYVRGIYAKYLVTTWRGQQVPNFRAHRAFRSSGPVFS